jgi:hypothetical protein
VLRKNARSRISEKGGMFLCFDRFIKQRKLNQCLAAHDDRIVVQAASAQRFAQHFNRPMMRNLVLDFAGFLFFGLEYHALTSFV